jgi:hypothetical protein
MKPFKNYRKRQIGYLIGFLFSLFAWVIVFLVIACSPVVTSHSGYVIHMDSKIIAVEHERMDKIGYGIVRYYPFIDGFEIGERYPKTLSIQPKPNGLELMADKNNR